jgi:hypothetical protein
MINNHFFKVLQLLRETWHRSESFNLFKVLRKDSDEVRLHSRFIAAILDPDGSHRAGNTYLKLFLKQVELNDFTAQNSKVFAEYQGIDILIRNDSGQAIVIENKIYAGDQHQQLYRYYQTMKEEGIEDITIIYLTLYGKEPESQSVEGLDSDFLESKKYQLLSYQHDINHWVEQCVHHAALQPPLRESFAQYLQLIEQLTGMDQSETHMQKLKELLCEEENLANFHDLKRAYTETLIDLQIDLWHKMVEYQQNVYPKMGKPSDDSVTNTDIQATVEKFYYKSKNNRYFGLYYPFSNRNEAVHGGVGMHIEKQLYIGIWCDKNEHSRAHQKFVKLFKAAHNGLTTDGWPLWKYIKQGIDFKEPNRKALLILGDDEQRLQLAKSIIDELHIIWQDVMSKIDSGEIKS